MHRYIIAWLYYKIFIGDKCKYKDTNYRTKYVEWTPCTSLTYCIRYLNNKVFASLGSGEIFIYSRDSGGVISTVYLVHSTVYSLQCRNVFSLLYTVQSRVYSWVMSTVYSVTVQCTVESTVCNCLVYSLQVSNVCCLLCTLIILQSTVYSEGMSTVFSVHCTVCSLQCRNVYSLLSHCTVYNLQSSNV